MSQLFISIFIFLSQIYRGYLQVLSNCIALIVRNGGGSSVTFEIETQCATFKGWKLDPHVAHSCPKCFGGLGKLWIVRKFRFLCFEVQVCLYECQCRSYFKSKPWKIETVSRSRLKYFNFLLFNFGMFDCQFRCYLKSKPWKIETVSS